MLGSNNVHNLLFTKFNTNTNHNTQIYAKYSWITTRDSGLDIMSTYLLRISSCISVEEGPVGFGTENQMG